jgi:hypothetical protein
MTKMNGSESSDVDFAVCDTIFSSVLCMLGDEYCYRYPSIFGRRRAASGAERFERKYLSTLFCKSLPKASQTQQKILSRSVVSGSFAGMIDNALCSGCWPFHAIGVDKRINTILSKSCRTSQKLFTFVWCRGCPNMAIASSSKRNLAEHKDSNPVPATPKRSKSPFESTDLCGVRATLETLPIDSVVSFGSLF